MPAKRKLIVLVAVISAVVAGGAYAATQSSTSNPRQAFLNDLAKRLNVSPSKLQSALQGALADRLKAAVAAGRITQAEANAILRRAAQRGGAPLLKPRFFGGHRFGEHGPIGAAASYLGVSPQTLFKDLSSGKSLAQVAKSRGKSVSGLEQALLNDIKTRLDRAVAAKMISKAQEQRILSRASARLSEKINRAGFGPRFHGGPGGPGAPGFRHGAPDFRGGPPPGAPGDGGPGLFGGAAPAPAAGPTE